MFSKHIPGEQLLMSLGWKPGQGIGPKVTKKDKKARVASHSKVYGCAMPQETQDEPQEEELDDNMRKYKDFLFAPDEIF